MKNRTLFILLAALCPLAFLTFMSLVDFFQVPPRSAPDDGVLLDGISRGAYARQESTKTAAGLLTGLESTHFIVPAVRDGEVFVNMAQYENYRADVDYFRQWNVVLRNLTDTLWPLRKIQAKNLKDMEDVASDSVETAQAAEKSVRKAYLNLKRYGGDLQKSLNEFSGENSKDSASEKIQNYCTKINEMIQLVSDRVSRSRSIFDSKVMFMEAQEKFEENNFLDARRICAKVLTNEALEPDFKTEVQKMNYQASCQIGMRELKTIEEATGRLEDKIDDIQEATRKVEDAGKNLDADVKDSLGAEYFEKASEMTVQYVDECYSSDIAKLQEELKTFPPESFVQALHDAKTIVDKINEMEKKMRVGARQKDSFPQVEVLREKTREIVTLILDQKLPAEVSSDEHIQEAELVNGSIVNGYFREVKEEGKTVGYKIYSSYDEYQNPTSSKGITSIDEFHVLPGPSLEARCAEDYTAARKEFMRDFDRRSSWNEFLGKCERMDRDLEKWEEKSQQKACFSVKKSISIMKGTLKDENWNIMDEVF